MRGAARARRAAVLLAAAAVCGCDLNIPLLVWHEGGKHTIVPPALSARVRNEDGSLVEWYTPLYHRTRDPDGSTISWHAGPVAKGPDYNVVFPLYFQGKDRWFTPLGPCGRWERPDGSSSVLATPLYYHRREADGAMKTRWVLPFYMREGGESYIPPLLTGWQKEEGKVLSWYSVPVLSGGWTDPDGSSSTWLTPLVHWKCDPSGTVTDWHALTAYGLEGGHTGLFPLWAHGPDYLAFPFLLSGRRVGAGEARSVWMTPLYHHSYDGSGKLVYRHFLPFFAKWVGPAKAEVVVIPPLLYGHARDRMGNVSRVAGPVYWSRDFRAVVPLVWWRRTRTGGSRFTVFPLYHRAVDARGRLEREVFFPLYLRTPEYSLNLPLLGGRVTRWDGSSVWGSLWGPTLSVRRADGSSVFWLTPLYHHSRDADGERVSWHLGPFGRGEDYLSLFPFYWRVRSGEEAHHGSPFYVRGPGYWCAPPLLSGGRTRADGTRDTFCGPLLSRHSYMPDGSSSAWALFPLIHYRCDPEANVTWSHFLPFYTRSPTHWSAPLLLSYSRETYDGGRQKMILGPLYYERTWSDGSNSVWTLWPFYHHERDAEGNVTKRHVLPFYIRGEGYTVYPMFLSGRWLSWDGSRHVWIALLYHHTRDGTGKVVERRVLPFYARGEGYRLCPVALSGRWVSHDGSEHTWLTPLWHWTRDKEGKVLHWHFLTFGGWEGRWSAFPFAFGGRRGWAAPLLLSGSWADYAGGSHTWVTPLFHRSVDRRGKLKHEHYLLYARWRENTWVFPFYGRGPDHWTSPVLLSGGWKLRGGGRLALSVPLLSGKRQYADGSSSAWITPLLLWMRRKAPGLPAEFQVLGGLISGRRCDYEKGTYRNYFLFGIPWGREKSFPRRSGPGGGGEAPRKRAGRGRSRRRPRRPSTSSTRGRKISLERREPGG